MNIIDIVKIVVTTFDVMFEIALLAILFFGVKKNEESNKSFYIFIFMILLLFVVNVMCIWR